MSVHVCKCIHNGRVEFHIRYPGMSESEALELADSINAGKYPSIKNRNKELELLSDVPIIKINDIVSHIDSLESNINMRRDRPYNGQAHTDSGIRGATEIKGITMRDLRDAFIRAFIITHPVYINGTLEPLQPNKALADEAAKGPDAVLCGNDLFTLKDDFDPIALSQNLTCEVERLMGIFPNLPGYTKRGYDHESINNKNV